MKSKRITMYVCEKCNKEFRSKEDCMEHEKSHNPMPELENQDILIFSNGKYGFYVDGNIIYAQDGNHSGWDYSEEVKDNIVKIIRNYNCCGRKFFSLAFIKRYAAGEYSEDIAWERKDK